MRRHAIQICEPGILSPSPDFRGEDIGQNQAVEQIGENKDLHIGEGDGRGTTFQFKRYVFHGVGKRFPCIQLFVI